MNTVQPIKDLNKIKEMREFLRSQSLRNELLFILGINIGIRISDILKLKTSDLLKPNGTVKDDVTITEKKTSKTKKFYISNVVKLLLTEYYIKNPNLIDQESYVFTSRKGINKPMSRQQAYRIISDGAEHIGIVEKDDKGNLVEGEIGTHTLRKTFGYHAYKNGTSMELLMNIFNHSSVAMTLRYIGITEDNKKDVYLGINLG